MKWISCLFFYVAILINASGCRSGLESKERHSSPDNKFAIISTDSKLRLVALPSHKVLLSDFNVGNQDLSILWSKDSSRFTCYADSGRSSECRAFQRIGDSFSEMKLPELILPHEAALKNKVTKWIGQRDKPLRWDDTTLTIETHGRVRVLSDTYIDYKYEFTVAFDENGQGKVTKVEKKLFKEL